MTVFVRFARRPPDTSISETSGRPVQLALRAGARRPVPAALRRHRSRTIQAGIRASHCRRSRLDRYPARRRRAAVRSPVALRCGRRSPSRQRGPLSLLRDRRRARADAQAPHGTGPAAHLWAGGASSHRRGSRAAGSGGPSAPLALPASELRRGSASTVAHGRPLGRRRARSSDGGPRLAVGPVSCARTARTSTRSVRSWTTAKWGSRTSCAATIT